MRKIIFFSGNRAEFGILFPIIAEFYQHFHIELVLSGAHVLPKWNTYRDVAEQLKAENIQCEIHRIELPESGDNYLMSLGAIYDRMIRFYADHDADYGIVLGDRIESFAFALATFYSRVPLIHLCGGDVTNVAIFDSNVRHSITKIANYHLVTSEESYRTLLQLGEEEHRILNIGNPSFDYERMNYLTPLSVLMQKYGLTGDQKIGLLTYHPEADKTTEENFADFAAVYQGVKNSLLDKIIVTYPNNDPGYTKIIDFIEHIQEQDRILVVKSLGTYNYLGIMRHFQTFVIGNSSSGLLETAYYKVPALNIGSRQKDRVRGDNVRDCGIDSDEIRACIDEMIVNYEKLQAELEAGRFKFGDGHAAPKAYVFLKQIGQFSREEQLFKRFVERLP